MLIRSYQPGDEKEILALDRRLETHPWNRRDIKNWYWKYTEQNPAGKSFIWLIPEGDKIIAHFAVIPYRIKVFNEELTASHSIAALVEEKYQNRGLLKFVGDKLFQEVEENNLPFTYGFPNDRSYWLHKRFMSYEDLVKFDTWKIIKHNIAKYESAPDFKAIEEFDNSVDKLWYLAKDQYKIAVVRNKHYLNWRYLQRPDCKYYPFGIYENQELRGYVVLKLYQQKRILRGHILDIFALAGDEKTLSQLIDSSLHFFHTKMVDEVTSWIWGNSLIEKLFKRKGFYKEITQAPLVIRLNQEFKYTKEVADHGNWYFTMGDSTEIF